MPCTISFQWMSSKIIKKIYDEIIGLSKAVWKESIYETYASRFFTYKHTQVREKNIYKF